MATYMMCMHPNELCKCCNDGLHAEHPSIHCACCQVAWEKTNKIESLQRFVDSMIRSSQAAIPVAKQKTVLKRDGLDINIVITTKHVEGGDSLLLFAKHGAKELDERVYLFPEETTMADIMVKFQIFSSKGQARKAGWGHSVPDGWTEVTVGKLQNTFCIWKPTISAYDDLGSTEEDIGIGRKV